MDGPDEEVRKADARIARAKADGLFLDRDHLLYQPGAELALGDTELAPSPSYDWTRVPYRIREWPPHIGFARAALGLWRNAPGGREEMPPGLARRAFPRARRRP